MLRTGGRGGRPNLQHGKQFMDDVKLGTYVSMKSDKEILREIRVEDDFKPISNWKGKRKKNNAS